MWGLNERVFRHLNSTFGSSRIANDFILIVGFWKDKKDNIIDEKILYINHNKFTNYLNFDKYNDMMYQEMHTISNSYDDDNKWKIFREKYKSLWPIINIRFKRDHKKQKRIQCAISWCNFNTFTNEFENINNYY